MKRNSYSIISILVLLILSSCVSQKKKDDRSAISKLYHNTTAHYNGYFNANEIIEGAVMQMEDQSKDDYTDILPVFAYSSTENAQSYASELDVAIEKVTRVVAIHKDKSHWIDDCYFLAGKAQFLKQDYESAEETFRYLIAEYDPSKENFNTETKISAKDRRKLSAKEKKKRAKTRKKEARKKKKEYNKKVRQRKKARKKGKSVKKSIKKPTDDEKEEAAGKSAKEIKQEQKEAKKAEKKANEPEDYFLKHRPVFQEGKLWLAKTLIERDNYDASVRLMNELAQNPRTFDDVKQQLFKIQADLYLQRGDYAAAIPALESAINQASKRSDKARLSYIIAQVYEQQGQGQQAKAAYENVLKFGPVYEMEFHCRLNMAQNAYRFAGGSATQAIDELEKLLKDEKNEEYKDQIYYAMAQIALDSGDKEQGIAWLKESLKNGASNNQQRATSYLTLADLYFEAEDFVPAKNYFDSTMTFLPDTHERYAEVKKLNDNLTEIAEKITFISLQDSLLRISQLPEDEKRAMAYNILQEQQEAARAKATSNSGDQQLAITRRDFNGGSPGALQKESNFFAYDDRSVKRGKRDFERRWGNRPLGDNWRLSAKLSGGADEIEAEDEINEVAATALTEDQLSTLLENVPSNDSERLEAELEIAKALFDLGSLYRSKLDNNEKAIEALEELDRRFPRSNYELDAWYSLYLAHNALNQNAQANTYKQKIIERYTSSTYAKVLQDPAYAQRLADAEYEVNMYYQNAYDKFTAGQIDEALRLCQTSDDQFGADHKLQPRFALLAALCIGKKEGTAAYKNALNEVITNYPNTDEQRRAREILRFIGGATASLPGTAEETDSNFKVEDNQVHYIIVSFAGNVNLNDTKVAASNYNRKFHKLDGLRISNIFLGTDAESRIPMLIIRRFKNREEAMRYYEGTVTNKADFMPDGVFYDTYAISLNNYREVLRSKSVDGYKAFFEANYLQ